MKIIIAQATLAKLICIILALLILWQALAGIFSLVTIGKGAEMTVAPSANKKIKEKASDAAFKTPFFGEYLPKNLNDANVKESMLNLTVMGIITASDEQESQVIIRTTAGEEQIYSVGDILPGGAIIKRITPEGVLVGRHGILESLSLPKNELIFERPPEPLVRE